MKKRKINIKTLLSKTILYRTIVIIIQAIFTYFFIQNWERAFNISIVWNLVNCLLFFVYSYYFDIKKSPYIETKGICLVFSGLSGSGKSTISEKVEKELLKRGKTVEILDGDKVRNTINEDLGYSIEDRYTNLKRASYLARFLVNNNVIVLFSFINPTNETQEMIRSIIGRSIKIYVKCSLKECIKRDTKGLYKKALNKEIDNFTGISSPYESPITPQIILDTKKESIEKSTKKVINYLQNNKII